MFFRKLNLTLEDCYQDRTYSKAYEDKFEIVHCICLEEVLSCLLV